MNDGQNKRASKRDCPPLTPLSIAKALRDNATGDCWLSDGSERGGGRLVLRIKNGKGSWFFRYVMSDGRRDAYPLGPYVEAPKNAAAAELGKGYNLSAARAKAKEYGELLKEPATRNIRAHFANQEADRLKLEQDKLDREAAIERAKQEQGRFTLGELMRIYCEHLRAKGRVSAKGVADAVRLHIFEERPDLAAMPAKQVSRADIALVIRALSEQGKTRTAGLLRSYLMAAYRLAMAAEGDPQAPSALIPFGIEHSPVDGIKGFAVATRERVLTAPELRMVLAHMAESQSVVAHLLRACILAGGQRPQQMARATVQDFDANDGTLLLWDGKGKRQQARAHLLPLAGEAKAHIGVMAERARLLGTDLLFSDEGKTPVRLPSIGKWVANRCAAWVAAGDLPAAFQAKDLRRTAETLMAKNRFPKDLRAQIMSHGLSGLQHVRYDRHDYLEEKRAALERWEALLLRPESAKVVPMVRRR